MIGKILAVTLAAGLSAAALTSSPAEAQSAQRRATNASPNSSYMASPTTRVYVTRRHWLDAGTEVRPGDRKFLDYAFPLTSPSGNMAYAPYWGIPF